MVFPLRLENNFAASLKGSVIFYPACASMDKAYSTDIVCIMDFWLCNIFYRAKSVKHEVADSLLDCKVPEGIHEQPHSLRSRDLGPTVLIHD